MTLNDDPMTCSDLPAKGERTPAEQLLWDIFGNEERVYDKTVHPHDHAERVEGCFRCDLSAEEDR